ncbi:MAG: class I SAM-dependent RNA methyltransferase [Gemmatimonadaceae bacterium]|nr:class I SAM-dependent RNA methyltransferase [Gemmatimonadaceae bacterium]
MPAPRTSFSAFAVAAPGLAALVGEELRDLGADVTQVDDAGVSFAADHAALYRANIGSRIASRIVVRAASFRAAHFSELEKRARAVDWERWIAPGRPVMVRASSRKSRLFHTGGIAERACEAIAHSVGEVRRDEAVDDDDDVGDAQLVIVRLERDQCTISIDSSGALLHRRGYRQAVAKAPLRETLAAAILRAAGYTGGAPLVDPCCGSGTIPIEAAMIARHMAPGLQRTFAFERWPSFASKAWGTVQERARDAVRATGLPTIVGTDRDAGAIEAARANAARAGVADDIVFDRRPLSRSEPPSGAAGLLVSNPPYGARIGDPEALRSLYAAFGAHARGLFAGWRVALLATDPRLVGQARLGLRPVLRTVNGGIRVSLFA